MFLDSEMTKLKKLKIWYFSKQVSPRFWSKALYRGYYTVARRYEFYFQVAKRYFTNERSE